MAPPAFPPNLDDGELWLPSAIIPDVLGVEALAHQLPVLGYLDPSRNPIAQGFWPATRFEAAGSRFGSAPSSGFWFPPAIGSFLPVPRTAATQVAGVLPKPEPVQLAPVRFGGNGGTGVFLPNVAYSNNAAKFKPKAKNGGYGGQQEKKNRQQQQQQSMRHAGGRKKEEKAAKASSSSSASRAAASPAEITLPQEWTY